MRAHARTKAGGTTHRPECSSRPVKGGAEDPPGEPRPDEPALTLQITPPTHHPHDPQCHQIHPGAGPSVCPHPPSHPALARILLHSQTFTAPIIQRGQPQGMRYLQKRRDLVIYHACMAVTDSMNIRVDSNERHIMLARQSCRRSLFRMKQCGCGHYGPHDKPA